MDKNIVGKAYALTILSPIRNGHTSEQIAYADLIRNRLQNWNFEHNSPMALVPNTYLSRFYVLDDVPVQSYPGGSAPDTFWDFLPYVPDFLRRSSMPHEDHLKSRYLVFSANCYVGENGDIDGYLRDMWKAIAPRIQEIWQYCYGFEKVNGAEQFIAYMKKCSLPVSLFFVGSNDESLKEQLKALYLKQSLARFAVEHQGLDAASLRIKFKEFLAHVQINNLDKPTWEAGKYRL
jgi:hypothetical protein